MSVLHAIVLGIVQGLSEFLPISSSGHLQLVPWLFGWEDLQGEPQLQRTFDVALHVGTFVGAFAFFRHDVVRLLDAAGRSLRHRRLRTPDERLVWLLAVASVPAATIGFVLDSVLEVEDTAEWLVAVMLIVFGLVLGLVDRLPERRGVDDFSLRDAVLMGLAQALALQPGVSRSGATISMGRWLGLDRTAATRISFLMSLPVIAGAGLYKGLQTATGEGIPASFVPAFVWGMVAAAVTGFLAVWGLLRLVQRATFAPFVVYRVVLGAAVLALVAAGFRS